MTTEPEASAPSPTRFYEAPSTPLSALALPSSVARWARVAGKPTWGNKCMVPVPPSLADAGARRCRSDEDLQALRASLQDACGVDRAYIETVWFTRREQQAPFLDVSYRSPIEENDDTLVVRMALAAEQWLRARVVGS